MLYLRSKALSLNRSNRPSNTPSTYHYQHYFNHMVILLMISKLFNESLNTSIVNCGTSRVALGIYWSALSNYHDQKERQ